MRRWRDQAPAFFCVLRAASLMLVLAIAPSAPAQELAVDVVNASTPTLCAENDNVDGPSNSLSYYRALKDAGVRAELHLYAEGGHAFGLRRTTFPITAWPQLVETWLQTIGMIAP